MECLLEDANVSSHIVAGSKRFENQSSQIERLKGCSNFALHRWSTTIGMLWLCTRIKSVLPFMSVWMVVYRTNITAYSYSFFALITPWCCLGSWGWGCLWRYTLDHPESNKKYFFLILWKFIMISDQEISANKTHSMRNRALKKCTGTPPIALLGLKPYLGYGWI